jgi:hypothetical protein
MSSENTARRGQGKAVGFMAGGFAIYREHFSGVIIPWGGGLAPRSIRAAKRRTLTADAWHKPNVNEAKVLLIFRSFSGSDGSPQ